MGNNENVVITNQNSIVDKFVHEFERLWIQFDPSNELVGDKDVNRVKDD